MDRRHPERPARGRRLREAHLPAGPSAIWGLTSAVASTASASVVWFAGRATSASSPMSAKESQARSTAHARTDLASNHYSVGRRNASRAAPMIPSTMMRTAEAPVETRASSEPSTASPWVAVWRGRVRSSPARASNWVPRMLPALMYAPRRAPCVARTVAMAGRRSGTTTPPARALPGQHPGVRAVSRSARRRLDQWASFCRRSAAARPASERGTTMGLSLIHI